MIRNNDPYVGKLIKITYCWAIGNPVYSKFLPGSTHFIITSPPGCRNSEKGVWVKGFTDNAYLNKEEYQFITIIRKK